ncbi:carbohydrate ABC transporter permease [Murimonas intestini]|uniref:Carbohydrate ABC transporter membrane protein 1 (CUT1 family) n=1 Tax=Murimonas intestini TaxID=1337051 RepID=A0AB73T431_9FIRM|nr:sugar ABC transporter permease [Murimonas intestini]MCR1841002.1 sugar ABC transporter permease [Murimonas intestini]MCR1865880.1 sugar ABC transporter permease [Murimonas intestini]MCR1883300.1 sugar ABC transporter permease [Murimonas intestini]
MKKKTKTIYSAWFLAPAVIIFGLLFIIPTVISLFFSMTVWDLSSFRWVGLQNFIDFFSEYSLRIGIKNTFIYAAATCVLKVVIGLLFAVILTSKIRTKNLVRSIIFFPNLISTVAVGIIFSALMHPSKGLFNEVLGFLGIGGINWLGDRSIALYSVIMTDVWKGVGVATVIYIAGISAIPKDYYEAASLDGATSVKQFFTITIPLCRSSINSVIILAFIGGMRTFDLIWSMTGGGPGFATDTIASVIYKQYAAGFYGLSTAGNVIMFLLIAVIAFPLFNYLTSKEVEV